MPAFKIDDTNSIKEYIESLDIFHHFDKIDVQHIANHLQLTIISNSREVYREFVKVSDRRTNQVFLGDAFYTQMNLLSAALEIQNRLDKLEDFRSSNIFFNPGWIAVESENGNVRYEINIYDRDEGFRMFVKTTFFENTEKIHSERMYCTKGTFLELSQLEAAVERFNKLDAVRTGE